MAAAVRMMTQYGKVTLVGTSRGTLRAASGIAAGARPSRLVLTSGFLTNESGSSENVAGILGTPATLPPTLVVHHRHDECDKTAPSGVAPFVAWAGGKARVVWLDGGLSEGRACEAMAHHGFNGIDGSVVAAVSAFAARWREPTASREGSQLDPSRDAPGEVAARFEASPWAPSACQVRQVSV